MSSQDATDDDLRQRVEQLEQQLEAIEDEAKQSQAAGQSEWMLGRRSMLGLLGLGGVAAAGSQLGSASEHGDVRVSCEWRGNQSANDYSLVNLNELHGSQLTNDRLVQSLVGDGLSIDASGDLTSTAEDASGTGWSSDGSTANLQVGTADFQGGDATGIGSLNTDTANITERWDFDTGYQLETTNITDSSDYDNEPWLVPVDNYCLLVYRTGSQHGSNDGKLVQRRVSASDLETNGADAFVNASETTIVDDGSYDDRNQTLIVKNGTVIMHYRVYDSSAGSHIEARRVTSDDAGASWSSPTTQTISSVNTGVPFGRPVETSNGLMQLFDGLNDGFSALFRTNGTWGNETQLTTNSNAVEPVPIAITDDKILIYARRKSGGWYVYKSTDGGQSASQDGSFWEDKQETPAELRRTGRGEVTIMYGDRDFYEIYAHQVAPDTLWNTPSEFGNSTRQKVYDGLESSRTANFGYPRVASLGDSATHRVAAWYDGDGDSGTDQITDIIIGSLPSGGQKPTYRDATDLIDEQGRKINSFDGFLLDDFGDNNTTGRSGQAISQFNDPENGFLSAVYRPEWTQTATNGLSVQNSRLEWSAGSGNASLTYSGSGGVPVVAEWQFSFKFSTLGSDDDDIQFNVIRADSNNLWRLALTDNDVLLLRNIDGGTNTDYSDTSGGSTGSASWGNDTNKHFAQIRRYPGGHWTVDVDGVTQIEATDATLPSSNQLRFKFTDSSGGSTIYVPYIGVVSST